MAELQGQKTELSQFWVRKYELITEEHEGTFQGDENELCPDFGGGYMTVYICQNLQNCTRRRLRFIAYELYPKESDFKNGLVL